MFYLAACIHVLLFGVPFAPAIALYCRRVSCLPVQHTVATVPSAGFPNSALSGFSERSWISLPSARETFCCFCTNERAGSAACTSRRLSVRSYRIVVNFACSPINASSASLRPLALRLDRLRCFVLRGVPRNLLLAESKQRARRILQLRL